MGELQQLWTEKYRPQAFSEIVGHQDIIKRVEAFVKQKNVPHLLLAGRAGIGKCVGPQTPILDGDGNLLSIEEAYKKKIRTVMSLDKNGHITPSKISYFYKGHSDLTYIIKSQHGAEIRVTPEHPFLTLINGKLQWVEANDLKENTSIASPLTVKKRKIKEIM